MRFKRLLTSSKRAGLNSIPSPIAPTSCEISFSSIYVLSIRSASSPAGWYTFCNPWRMCRLSFKANSSPPSSEANSCSTRYSPALISSAWFSVSDSCSSSSCSPPSSWASSSCSSWKRTKSSSALLFSARAMSSTNSFSNCFQLA